MKQAIYLLFILFLFASCDKESTTEPLLTDEPILRVLSITPNVAREFVDQVELELEYEDLNGDLGSDDPDEGVLSVKDSRLAEADLYHVKPLAPEDEEVHIKGTFKVKLNTLFILGNGNSEDVTFTVKIQDRSGRWSQPVTSPTVSITR